MTSNLPAPLVEMRDIFKSFGAVVALEGVHLQVYSGEVVGLVGDNGAGKSTLMKILSGALTPDEGELLINGESVNFKSPRDARTQGIEMVYQDLALCDDLDVASNFFLGREPGSFGFLKLNLMHNKAREELNNLGIRIQSTDIPIRSISGGQRQAVAIGRAFSFNPQVLILDEPTAALGVHEVEVVLHLIKEIRNKGVGVILISHRLQDIMDVCDRVIVLYEGRNESDLNVKEISIEDLVAHIVGRKMQNHS